MSSLAESRRFDLRKPLIAAALALLVALPVTIYGTDIAWFLYSAAVTVLGSLVLLIQSIFEMSIRLAPMILVPSFFEGRPI